MTAPPDLPADWPLRDHSALVACPPHRWHVQTLGSGPTLLLLHGAGGAAHSWRNLAPLLAQHFRLVMPDLPGHGFTRQGNRSRLGLDGMAEDTARLLRHLGETPVAIVGHSAGAAIALRMAEDMPLRAVIGINAALGQFEGIAGVIFPAMARALALLPFIPTAFSRLSGTPQRVAALIDSTGSRIDARGLDLYRRLVNMPAHVDGTLAMMSQWRLQGLLSRLPGLQPPTLLIAAEDDRTVPPDVSARAASRMPGARLLRLAEGGHLVHESHAAAVAQAVIAFLAATGTPVGRQAPVSGP
jgi:magnesium chelatase accessory protein